jgi:hypothetical protein
MNTTNFFKGYLTAIGIEEKDYDLKESQDTLGYLMSLTLAKSHPKIGILIGKRGRNLRLLKQQLRVVGFCERIIPFLIIKLE